MAAPSPPLTRRGRRCSSRDLFSAAARGSIEGVRYWLRRGTNVGDTDREGRTALSLACQRAHPIVVEYLLERGADPDCHDPVENMRTPLMVCAAKGESRMVGLLLAYGADKHRQDAAGATARQLCALGAVPRIRFEKRAGEYKHIAMLLRRRRPVRPNRRYTDGAGNDLDDLNDSLEWSSGSRGVAGGKCGERKSRSRSPRRRRSRTNSMSPPPPPPQPELSSSRTMRATSDPTPSTSRPRARRGNRSPSRAHIAKTDAAAAASASAVLDESIRDNKNAPSPGHLLTGTRRPKRTRTKVKKKKKNSSSSRGDSSTTTTTTINTREPGSPLSVLAALAAADVVLAAGEEKNTAGSRGFAETGTAMPTPPKTLCRGARVYRGARGARGLSITVPVSGGGGGGFAGGGSDDDDSGAGASGGASKNMHDGASPRQVLRDAVRRMRESDDGSGSMSSRSGDGGEGLDSGRDSRSSDGFAMEDLEQWLHALQLSAYKDELVEMGVRRVRDLRLVEDEDLEGMMARIEKRKFLKASAKLKTPTARRRSLSAPKETQAVTTTSTGTFTDVDIDTSSTVGTATTIRAKSPAKSPEAAAAAVVVRAAVSTALSARRRIVSVVDTDQQPRLSTPAVPSAPQSPKASAAMVVPSASISPRSARRLFSFDDCGSGSSGISSIGSGGSATRSNKHSSNTNQHDHEHQAAAAAAAAASRPPRPPPPKYRRKFSLHLGVDSYAHWPRLSRARGDAESLSAYFAKELGFESRCLVEESVTKEGIERVITDDFCNVCHADDLFVLTFHGHGHTKLVGAGQEHGFVVPATAARDSNADLVSMRSLRCWIEYLPCRHTLLILDCCFSGLAACVRGWPGGDGRHHQMVHDHLKHRACLVINAGTKDQMVSDAGWGETNSVFTGALMACPSLHDGLGSALGLFRWLQMTVSAHSAQTPTIGLLPGHEGGDIYLGLSEEKRRRHDRSRHGGAAHKTQQHRAGTAAASITATATPSARLSRTEGGDSWQEWHRERRRSGSLKGGKVYKEAEGEGEREGKNKDHSSGIRPSHAPLVRRKTRSFESMRGHRRSLSYTYG